MSIFRKILILFVVSFILMSVIGFWIDNINEKRINNLIKDKYAKISFEILNNINNPNKIDEILKRNDLIKIESKGFQNGTILFEEIITFGYVKVLQENFNDSLVLDIKYLDDEYILKTKNEQSISDKYILNLLIWLDIIALIVMFLFVLKTLSPIKKISKQISSFAGGDFSSRIECKDKKSKNEITVLANTFNDMASKIESFITTRETLLRDIGHELRTPIAKGKFAIEKIDDFSQKELLKKIFSDLEILTNELIELEKLNSSNLDYEIFSAEKLIIESLQKLYIENEDKIEVVIDENFKITGDLYYLCIALKNLIDNALKYSTKFPIIVGASNNEISVSSFGKKLSKDIEYYLCAFTQESAQRNGFGLGLSIVKKIIDKHHFKIDYKCKENINTFFIKF